MCRSFRAIAMLFFVAIVLLPGCRKQEFDEFYGRPGWLASPIYQQLDSMGSFKNYLVCIDKAGYKNTLGTAGSWTVFAPTDDAFKTFMSENNITDINSISDSLASKIVRTSMIYDGEKIERLKDNFSQAGWVEDIAFRRRTVYYDFVETSNSVIPNHQSKKFIATNRTAGSPYFPGDNNNKHISYFFKDYMTLNGLGESDYKAFYPQSNYTGLNVANAEIEVNRHDIIAENGVIHVINKVLMPEKSIDQYLRDNPQYSLFKSILDGFATYTYNENVSKRYEVLTGNKDSVFTKGYTSISLAVNNENFAKDDMNDAQVNNNSITVPTNAALTDYANKVLLKYYPAGTKIQDLFELNSVILREYVNSHLYNGQVWPSKFNTQNNILGESPKINTSDIIETKYLSNGAFYGVNKSQQANVFHSVYGNVLLDPDFSLMGRALELEGYNLTLKIPTLRYILIMVPDAVLNSMGFSYDSYFPSDPIRLNGGSGRNVLRRIMQQHIVPLSNYAIPDFSGKGMLETLNGDYIQYDNGYLISRGTLDNASLSLPTSVKIDSTNIGVAGVSGPTNGIAVYVNGALTYSDKTIGTHLTEFINNNPNSPYFRFFDYLKNSPELYKLATGEVTGVSVGVNYTFLIPTNTAITDAITNGILPGSTTTTDPLLRGKINDFLKYHIVKNSFSLDGKKTGTFESLYKDLDDNTKVVRVTNTTNPVSLTDESGRTISFNPNDSNKLGDRVLIHSLSSYLDYRKN
jgi:uncharacterized surface protein with fasciclin (FAS1) repeats